MTPTFFGEQVYLDVKYHLFRPVGVHDNLDAIELPLYSACCRRGAEVLAEVLDDDRFKRLII